MESKAFYWTKLLYKHIATESERQPGISKHFVHGRTDLLRISHVHLIQRESESVFLSFETIEHLVSEQWNGNYGNSCTRSFHQAVVPTMSDEQTCSLMSYNILAIAKTGNTVE